MGHLHPSVTSLDRTGRPSGGSYPGDLGQVCVHVLVADLHHLSDPLVVTAGEGWSQGQREGRICPGPPLLLQGPPPQRDPNLACRRAALTLLPSSCRWRSPWHRAACCWVSPVGGTQYSDTGTGRGDLGDTGWHGGDTGPVWGWLSLPCSGLHALIQSGWELVEGSSRSRYSRPLGIRNLIRRPWETSGLQRGLRPNPAHHLCRRPGEPQLPGWPRAQPSCCRHWK